MRSFSCAQCGNTVFFENHFCGACNAELGFDAQALCMRARQAGSADESAWVAEPEPVEAGTAIGEGADLARAAARWQVCAHRSGDVACNWLRALPPLDVADPAPADGRCASCGLTELAPDLGVPGNGERWRRIEAAKRRLLYALIRLGLAPEPKAGPGDILGLAFRFLGDVPGQPPVLTGQENGVVTLNIREADDGWRESVREQFGESQRTLLGHLRHEVSHYLQHRWVTPVPEAAERCRASFGDERADYAAALARHHAQGAPAGWALNHVSAYASSHPWEDWAETCAHHLLIVDASETAASWGVRLEGRAALAPQQAADVPTASWSDEVTLRWLPLARFMNAMNRSIGLADSYPFTMTDAVLHKLSTVQQLLAEAAAARLPVASPQTTPAEPPVAPDATQPATTPA